MPGGWVGSPSDSRTSLVGREQDAATVRQVLLRAQGRLLTLTGAGGCGKTRLALRVAGELRPSFSDGVALVELAALFDPRLVLEAVGAAVGVLEGSGGSLRDSLLGALEARALLLVLDNCEHLVDACARLAEELLGGCSELRILATSREP